MSYLPASDPGPATDLRPRSTLRARCWSEYAGRYIRAQAVLAHHDVQLGDLVRGQITDACRQGQEPVLFVRLDDTTRQRPELLDVLLAPDRSRTQRMRVRHGDLVLHDRAVRERDYHATAERLLGGVRRMVAAR